MWLEHMLRDGWLCMAAFDADALEQYVTEGQLRIATRGFDIEDAPAREQLEYSAFQLFVLGYELGIEQKTQDDLAIRLQSVQREYQGFAYEGAVMGLAIRDAFSPAGGGRRTEAFLAGPEFDSAPGSTHVFTAYAGIGSALARLPKALWRRALPEPGTLAGHPCMYWLIIDGYGWHKGFFEHQQVHRRTVRRRQVPGMGASQLRQPRHRPRPGPRDVVRERWQRKSVC